MPLVLQISFFTSTLLTGKNQYRGGGGARTCFEYWSIYRLELKASHLYTSGLEIILQLAPIKLSWQTFFVSCLNSTCFGLDKYLQNMYYITAP